MAREQSKGLDIRFKRADLRGAVVGKPGTFNLAIDGHCLHCIIKAEDRRAFLENTRRLLIEGGLFVLLTMCSPVDRKSLSEMTPGQKLFGRVIYAPSNKGAEFEGSRTFDGKSHMPTRYIGHWKSILTELQGCRFQPQLVRINHATPSNPVSSLSVGALAVD